MCQREYDHTKNGKGMVNGVISYDIKYINNAIKWITDGWWWSYICSVPVS